MKLVNFFYLGTQKTAYSEFRPHFGAHVSDARVQQLVRGCLREFSRAGAEPIVVKEWLLYEVRVSMNFEYPISHKVYLMSSVRPPDFFLKQGIFSSSGITHIGFCTSSGSVGIDIAVRL